MKHEILWLPDVEAHDYDAALDYLSLHYNDARVEAIVELLRNAPLVKRKAKDIARASGLALLGAQNHHVTHNLKKIAAGTPLSPVLLVRGEPLKVVDGYHRVSAVHLLDEDALIPCKLV